MLIDAHKLYEQYETAMCELVKSTNCENISLEALSLLCGAKLIADAPIIDAVPVKHGRWIHFNQEESTISGRCSCCGWEAHYYEDDVADMPYCPSCGARMDLEGQDD